MGAGLLAVASGTVLVEAAAGGVAVLGAGAWALAARVVERRRAAAQASFVVMVLLRVFGRAADRG